MPVSHAARTLTPRKSPRQARSRDTVAAILKAAAQVFATVGYAAGTTNRIAERAGVSIGSLYEYFPNKDALLVALMEAHVHEGEALILGVATQPGPADLAGNVRRFVQAMVAFHARDVALHRVLFEEAPIPRSLRRTLLDMEARLSAFVASYLRRHDEVQVADVDRAAAVVVHTVEALTHRFVLSGRREDDDVFTDEVVALVTSYLTRPRSAPAAAAPRRPSRSRRSTAPRA